MVTLDLRAEAKPGAKLATDLFNVTLLTVALLAFFAPFEKPSAASTALSANRVFEAGSLGGAMIGGLCLILTVRRARLSIDTSALLYLLFCIFALASSWWSPRAIYTILKGLEILMLLPIAMVFVAICLRRGDGAERIVHWLAVSLVLAVAVTLVYNVAVRGTPLAFTETGWMRGARLMGVYAHPTEYSDLLAITLVTILAAPWRRRWKYILGGCTALMLLLTDTRSAMAAFAVSCLAATVSTRRLSPARMIVVLVALCTAAVTLIYFYGTGSATGELSTLNGRLFIWAQSWEVFTSSPLWGVGYGSTADFLLMPSLEEAAGAAHSSYVEVILTLGLLGFSLMAAYFAVVGTRVLMIRDWFATAMFTYLALRSGFDFAVFAAEVPTVVMLVTAAYLGFKMRDRANDR